MNIKPLRDFVEVKKNEGPKQTAGGLYMPTTVEEKIITGTVITVGSGHMLEDGTVIPLEVMVGDRVAFNKNLAVEVTVDNESTFLLREDQIYCIVK